MNEQREEIIRNYIEGYNEFNVVKMTRDFGAEIVFQNIQNGAINLKIEGIEAFKQQAEKAKSYFITREQTLSTITHRAHETEIAVNYMAILKTDFPNGLKKGERLKLQGKSVFKFLHNNIISLTDFA